MTEQMVMYGCIVSGSVYDPKVGAPAAEVAPGVEFDALPNDWFCPECMVRKEQFAKVRP